VGLPQQIRGTGGSRCLNAAQLISEPSLARTALLLMLTPEMASMLLIDDKPACERQASRLVRASAPLHNARPTAAGTRKHGRLHSVSLLAPHAELSPFRGCSLRAPSNVFHAAVALAAESSDALSPASSSERANAMTEL
jgi:hypothetical protein